MPFKAQEGDTWGGSLHEGRIRGGGEINASDGCGLWSTKNVNLINDTQLLVKMGHGGFMNASAK